MAWSWWVVYSGEAKTASVTFGWELGLQVLPRSDTEVREVKTSQLEYLFGVVK